jgi:hypothetical protein
MVLDSGNGSKSLLQEMLYAEDVFFVIKRNLLTESVQEWLETEKANPEHEREARDGSQVYYKTIERTLPFDEVSETVKIVVVARERLHDAQGQMLLATEISVETYWTNLPAEATEVEHIYHQHGTSEQYHAELKSDLGVERLPSGKFYANTLRLLFSMLAFNLRRRIGTQMLLTQKVPGRRGRRLRLRTVLLSAMYLAGVIVSHAGRLMLRVSEHNAWSPSFMGSL